MSPSTQTGMVLSPANSNSDSHNSFPAETAKRTKASRACDECRRKKIRCDIGEETICTSCQRLGTVCTFSRVQLKRGPSKRQRSQSDAHVVNKSPLPGIDALLNWTPQSKMRSPMSPTLSASPPYHPYRRPSLPAPMNPIYSTSPPNNEVLPTALNYYYAHYHNLLPILPDTPAELNMLIRDASNCQCLVNAINGTATSVPVEPAYGASRITQLMALIFVYCNTTEPTWLGAAAANAMTLTHDTLLGRRLYFIVAILDRLHAAVFGTNKLLALEVDAPVSELARLYLWGEVKQDAITPPPDNLNEVCAAAMQCIVSGDNQRLDLLAPQLKDTPFAALINRALGKSPPLMPVRA